MFEIDTWHMNTTPIRSVEVEANIAPLDTRQDYLLAKLYCKLCYRPANDKTVRLLQVESGSSVVGTNNNFKRRATFALPNIEMLSWSRASSCSVILPPWIDIDKYLDCSMQLTNDICVYEQFIDKIVHKYNYECVYTDGSKCQVINSVSSAVFVACSGELNFWKLDPRHSVLGSELYDIFKRQLRLLTPCMSCI